MQKQTLYCSAPLDYPSAQRPLLRDGAEDVAGAAAKGLELRQLQITIRHGDRSAIHDLPNAEEHKWRCQPFSEEIQRKWEGVSRFSVQSVDGKPLERSFTPAVYAEEEMDQLGDEFKGQAGELCKHGQLTEAGIRQHLTLGDHMHKAYHSLLGDVAAEEIYIRSTDYTRTLESAAAFLMSFFPGSSGMTITTNEDQENEVMHGIGSKAISENNGGQGPEKTTVGTCERAAKLSEQQFLAFKPRPDVVAEVLGLFGEEVSELKMTSMADQMHALSCHNMTLPCSDKGCVSPEVAMDVMVEADRQMCLRYYGADGGGESAALSLYPFTTEILTNMRRALSGDSPTKFALFSGHDTVVAPLLAAFGAYDCRWPPYASHVAFELWSKPPAGQEDKDPPNRGLLGGGENGRGGEDAASRRALAEEGNGAAAGGEGAAEQGGGSAESGAGSPNNPSQEVIPPAGDAQEGASDAGEAGGKEEEAYVRVTFQGKPITHHITDCGPFEGPYGREFCPLSLFARTIARALGPHETLEEACRDLDTRY
ncbi:conserved unknown protein [Ectocarpus siliculosus]|uniref:Acid phosphatase n=1 Tax=Ectocarpus siliculosus TaxID=2880 RepID=D8LH47_ECTSI|nr:conserved unknown protein [Ectocarpus siliculosus]|eukprot:CBN74266.1 conserved unknown protein [Ectocarpus siliculosus]